MVLGLSSLTHLKIRSNQVIEGYFPNLTMVSMVISMVIPPVPRVASRHRLEHQLPIASQFFRGDRQGIAGLAHLGW